MMKYISALILSFFVYGFAGWIWESLICPPLMGYKIKNSGFLNGPIVPIYGVGALTVSLLFSSQETYLSIFIEGAFVACVIEYITSWGMEKLYHRRWWDYSDKAFHVNGRVCLEGFLVFGLFSVVAVKYVQPALLSKIMQHDVFLLVILATALTTILIIDTIATIISLTHLDERLEEFIKDIENYAQNAIEDFENNKDDFAQVVKLLQQKDKDTYIQILKKQKYSQRRILKAFPHLIHKHKNNDK